MAEVTNGGSGGDDGGGSTGDDPRRPSNFQGVITDDSGNALGTIELPDWLLRLQPLVGIVPVLLFIAGAPVVWVVATLLGVRVTPETIEALRRRQGPLWTDVVQPLQQKGPIAVILDDFLFRTILAPLGAALLDSALWVVNTVFAPFAFLANVILGAVGLSTQGILTGAAGIIAAIRAFNLSLVGPVTALGIGAQPAATAIGIGQIALAAWGLWILARSIDVPFIDPLGLGLAITRPFRNFLGGLFGR
jgi:hypothetical protein